jgi:hypothetical protein
MHPQDATLQKLLGTAAQGVVVLVVPAATTFGAAWPGVDVAAGPACQMPLVRVAPAATVAALVSPATWAAAKAAWTTMEAGAVGAVVRPPPPLPLPAQGLARAPELAAPQQAGVPAVQCACRAAAGAGLRGAAAAAAFARCCSPRVR